MLPLIEPFADADSLRQIKTAIHTGREAVAQKVSSDKLEKVEEETTQLVGTAELYSQGLFLEPEDEASPLAKLSSDQLRTLRDVADIAARAVRAAASGDAVRANAECEEGVSWAYSVVENSGDSSLSVKIDAMVRDVE